uniref:BTB domain-containing protein n=1 Tax=Strongyloides papillosus TaxID=174720 RepID=A0A0N5C0A2_STREA
MNNFKIFIISDDLCNVQGKVNKFNYVCSIENFSQRPEKTGEAIELPIFVSGNRDRSEWCLWIYPNGDREDSKEYVSVFLELLKPKKAKAKFMLSILNNKGEKKCFYCSEGVHEFDNSYENGEGSNWGSSEFVEKDFLLNKSKGLLANDKLTVLCLVEIIDLESGNYNNLETLNDITHQSKLALDFGSMFDKLLFTDCSIKVGRTTIKVHRGVLATRSLVFYNILNSTSRKSQKNVIEIKNFHVEVVKKMLRYIYTDHVSDIEHIASEVLAIAVEYGLDKLKEIAIECLCDDLTMGNVCERFILSEKFSSQELKEFCQDFIIDNAEPLIKTKNWEKIVIDHPLLVESLFLKLLNIPKTPDISSTEEKSETQ